MGSKYEKLLSYIFVNYGIRVRESSKITLPKI